MLRTNLGYLGGLLGKFTISTGGHDLSMQHLMKHIKLRYITLFVCSSEITHTLANCKVYIHAW